MERRDFLAAFRAITPASHRAAAAHARPLPPLVAPVLLDHLQAVLAQLQAGFPAAAACLRSGFGGGRNPAAGLGAPGADADSWDADPGLGGGAGAFSWAGAASLGVQRPRLLVCGPEGAGQGHLGPALLYALEGLPVHAIGLPSLLSDAGARAPEEALVHAVVEARRAAPAVLFLPHLQVGLAGRRWLAGGLDGWLAGWGRPACQPCLTCSSAVVGWGRPARQACLACSSALRASLTLRPASCLLARLPPLQPHPQVWWDTAPNSLRATLWMLLADLPADLPLLLFATADVPASGGCARRGYVRSRRAGVRQRGLPVPRSCAEGPPEPCPVSEPLTD